MSGSSSIEWTDATWNVVLGCTKVSPGCANCYIDRTPPFRINHRKFVRGATGLVIHEDRLELPFTWKKPRRVFVNSLSDLFHEDVPPALVGEMFRVMRDTPQHTYQILTKRPERMLEVLGMAPLLFEIPLPNVWLGVTIENARFNYRADLLRQAPAAVRFISAEPLLGSLLSSATSSRGVPADGPGVTAGDSSPDVEAGDSSPLAASADGPLSVQVGPETLRRPLDLTSIDWLIIGGESGPGSRPIRLSWMIELVEAARAAGTAPFVKQLGTPLGKFFGAGAKGGDIEKFPEPLQVREYPGQVVLI